MCICECVYVCVCVQYVCVCMCVLAALSIFPQVCAFSIRPLNSRLACLVHSLSPTRSLSLFFQSPVCSGAFYSASDKFFGSGRSGGKGGRGTLKPRCVSNILMKSIEVCANEIAFISLA